MKYFCSIILFLFSIQVGATSWSNVYPYIMMTENRQIKCRSVCYAPHDGPNAAGETFVYSKGKLLYSINKYFSNPFFTIGNGQYLIEVDFFHYYEPFKYVYSFTTRASEKQINPDRYDGDAVMIYKMVN